MEWVEITGKTIEEARDLALERLGVEADEAEFEVLEEPQKGLFGRMRGQARVRARIAPKTPRPKTTRRRKPKAEGADTGGRPETARAAKSEAPPSGRDGEAESAAGGREGGGSRPRKQAARKRTAEAVMTNDHDATPSESKGEPMSETAQTETVHTFLSGLTEAFGITAEVKTEWQDGELYADIRGERLGLLVGPGFGTLDAIQELTRGVLQRGAAGGDHAKANVDVVGVRVRRRTALEAFVKDQAAKVIDSGEAVAFEPMSSPDRKTVHDVANEIDGVATVSEGEDFRRRVVLLAEGN